MHHADRLHDALVAHTGETLFTTTLLDVITTTISTSNMTAKKNTAVKPKCYDELIMKSTTTRDELNAYVDTLDEREKSGALLYALTEKQDRNVIINTLAQKLDKLQPDDMKMLMTLTSSNSMDSENVTVFLDTNTSISQSLSAILTLVI